MRARKPWVRACLSLPGWKVRFMAKPEEFDGKRSGKVVYFPCFCQEDYPWRVAARRVDSQLPRSKIKVRNRPT
jgi:hypothetical protein